MADLSVAMVAGEKSGDLLASSLLAGLNEKQAFGQSGKAAGIGGDAMAAEGFENWWHIDALSVRGYLEVLPALPRLLWMRRQLRQRILQWQPSLFVGVDAPDFNLDLELALRASGQAVVHFISPSVWAWRRERMQKIRQAVDHMLLVFPFEAAIYAEAGVPATYVGHPLADVISPDTDREQQRKLLNLDLQQPVIALLPGSRPDEVRYMGASFLQTAVWLLDREPRTQFVVPAANAALRKVLEGLRAGLPEAAAAKIRILDGQAHTALGACDTALIASGTATLEAMFFHRPMVIAYKMSEISYRMMRGKGYLPHIGLPNILCAETVVPEFIQDQAQPQAMGAALLEQLNNPQHTESIERRFEALHLGMRLGCAHRAAEVLMNKRAAKSAAPAAVQTRQVRH